MSLPARVIPFRPAAAPLDDVDDYYADYQLTTEPPAFDDLEEQFFADGERLAERAEQAAAEMTALLADLAANR
jgi:hypothetical protein